MSTTKLYDLLKTKDINWFNAAVNISLKNKYVFVENPKVGSSTLKLALHAVETLGLRNVKAGPHPEVLSSPFVKPFQLTNEDLAEILFGDEFFRFCFVRHPYDRVLSAYLDKIVRRAPEVGQVDKYWEKTKGKKGENKYTFAEFIECVENTPDNLRDKHWRSQAGLTMAGTIRFHHIGRLETLPTDVSKIQSIAKIDLSHLKEFSPHKTDAKTKRKEFFADDKVRSAVRGIYDSDFKTFKFADAV